MHNYNKCIGSAGRIIKSVYCGLLGDIFLLTINFVKFVFFTANEVIMT